MMPASTLPELGSDFAARCDASVDDCLRRILVVTAARRALYDALAIRHAALVEWIEAADDDDRVSGQDPSR